MPTRGQLMRFGMARRLLTSLPMGDASVSLTILVVAFYVVVIVIVILAESSGGNW